MLNRKTRWISLHLSSTAKSTIMLANNVLLLSMPGGSEWILIIVAVLVLFGGRKIPEFMRGLGRGIREFNDAKSNVQKEIEDGMKEKDTPKAS
jgi:sec-independent protein translocase protein TatA